MGHGRITRPNLDEITGLSTTRFLGRNPGPFPMHFFFNSRHKIPNLRFFSFFGGGGGGVSNFISYKTNTEHIVTYSQLHRIIEYNHTCFFLSLSHCTLINIHYIALYLFGET